MIVVFIGTILGVILHQVTADWSVSVVIWPHHGIHVGLQQTTPYLPSLNHIQTLPSNSYTRLWSVTYYLFNSYCHTWTVICLKPHTHLDSTKTKLTTHKEMSALTKNKQLHLSGLVSRCNFYTLLVISMQLDFVCIFGGRNSKMC